MEFISSLLQFAAYLYLPDGLVPWLVWSIFLALIVGAIFRGRYFHPVWNKLNPLRFGILLVLTPVVTLFFGLRLPLGGGLPIPAVPTENAGPALMLFSALPWVLAAGLLGPGPAAFLAALSGIFLAVFDTHHLFTPLEFASLAVVFTAAVNQRYNSPFFDFLRRPLAAGMLAVLVYPIVVIVPGAFGFGNSLSASVDFAISRLGWGWVVLAGQIILAAVFAEVIAVGWPQSWNGPARLSPSPAKTSLEARFFLVFGPLVAALSIVLLTISWLLAVNQSERFIREQMTAAAQSAARSIPYSLAAGQDLAAQLAGDPRLYSASAQEITQLLQSNLRAVPYFTQFFVFDAQAQPVTGFPIADYQSLLPSSAERSAIDLALQGVPFQSFSQPPAGEAAAGTLSFVLALKDGSDQLRGVLLARSALSDNPLFQPLIGNLDQLSSLGGEGVILDSSGSLVYHPHPQSGFQPGNLSLLTEPVFTENIGPAGLRWHVYFQPVSGSSWAVIAAVPARQSQQIALAITLPLMGMLLFSIGLAYWVLRRGLGRVSNGLAALTTAANLVAEQRFDQPLPNLGTDEIGQFVTAFGNMRGKLHSHLQEINRLLLVSQGIASNLELESSVKPILETALAAGASFSRLVLTSAAQPDFDEDTPARFGHGPNAQAYSSLDSQLLELTQQQDVVSLTNPARAGLTFDPNTPPLDSILAVALRHENANYGALWVAYPESHKISEEQIRFITTVAGQAALAASNTRLFLSALIGRQRLEAILSSTPDPVLVTDYKDRLLIANPAALDLLNAGAQPQQGLPIDAIIKQTALLDLLRASDNEPKTAEITFPDKRVFFASSSAVTADNQQMGRVCVMRDITSLKELDALKTDFVNTVSHDLRAPLTLMRGYATMIQMVGELNAQQHDYVEKIVSGVEGMAGLVNSLLDLGRIESGIGGLQVGKVSVQEIAENIVEALQVRADQKQITLSIIHGQVSLPHVEADRHLLQQALHNLVENAIQYTDNGGQVRIELTVHEDGVLFAVGDTGMGIAPVDIPRLFERFYRVSHPDSSVQRGSGLGLAIVKSIAERHGGRVWAESQLGSGSTFYFLVPLRQPGI